MSALNEMMVWFQLYLHSFFYGSFRDRRYEYKGLNKVWKGKLAEAKASGNPIKIQEAQVRSPLTLRTRVHGNELIL